MEYHGNSRVVFSTTESPSKSLVSRDGPPCPCYQLEHCFSPRTLLEVIKNEASRQEYKATSKALLISEREEKALANEEGLQGRMPSGLWSLAFLLPPERKKSNPPFHLQT